MAIIAHLANFYGPRSGGLRTMMRETAAGYIAAGHEVHHVVPHSVTESIVDNGVHIHRIAAPVIPRSGGYRIILNRSRVIDLMDQLHPDVIEISDRLTLLKVADACWRQGIPTTMFAHERVDGVIASNLKFIPARFLADRLNKNSSHRVSNIVCTTEFASEEFSRIHVPTLFVPLGVDLDFFNPARRSRVQNYRQGDEILIGLCSRLSTEKRCDFAIEVVRHAVASKLKVRLVIAGDGPQMQALIKKARGLPVVFLGFIHDRVEIADLLANMDVVLAPGPIETFGLAALEALASGTPVLANSESAIPEVVGEGGLAVPLIEEDWVSAIAQLNSQGNIRAISRKRAESFSWNTSVQKLLEIHGLPTAVGKE